MKPFENVVAEHGPTVLRVCRAVLGPADAEDAWSETFMAALKSYPRLRAGSNVKGWLVTIAHRKAIDIVRARSRAPIAVARFPEVATAGPQAAGWGALWGALRNLPPRQREAVAYHYVGGLAYKDVAAITGSNTVAARRAAADGIAALRKSLQGRRTAKGVMR
jgi:RNA polymerase sigma factor (sigma-70 family)